MSTPDIFPMFPCFAYGWSSAEYFWMFLNRVWITSGNICISSFQDLLYTRCCCKNQEVLAYCRWLWHLPSVLSSEWEQLFRRKDVFVCSGIRGRRKGAGQGSETWLTSYVDRLNICIGGTVPLKSLSLSYPCEDASEKWFSTVERPCIQIVIVFFFSLITNMTISTVHRISSANQK